MIGKTQLLGSLKHESNVIKHLVGKVPAGKEDFRFTPKQRSTLELARYLTTAAIVATEFALTGSWDHYEKYEKPASKLALKDIPKALDEQVKQVEAALAKVSDQDLATKQAKMPWGQPCTLGEALLNMPLKFLTAYRMQLFLQAKASGADIGTSNCWGGQDAKKADG